MPSVIQQWCLQAIRYPLPFTAAHHSTATKRSRDQAEYNKVIDLWFKPQPQKPALNQNR
ncbi:MAG: hypothetical protein ACFB4I_08860 [Cyanophyceae cyanobacterium]